MAEKLELAPKEELAGTFAGFPIYINPRLSPGWVEFRDAKGNIIGMISDVGAVHLAPSRSPPRAPV